MLKHLQRAPSRKGKQMKGGVETGTSSASAVAIGAEKPTGASEYATKTLPSVPGSNLATAKSTKAPFPPTKRSLDAALRRRNPLPFSRSTIRPSTSASAVDAGPALGTVVPLQSGSGSASEAWRAPEDADGAYVRRTYAHFDANGVRGDGLLEGKEWTREKGPKAVWEANDGHNHRPRRVSMPPTTQPFGLKKETEPIPSSRSPSEKSGLLPPVPQKDRQPQSAHTDSFPSRRASPLLLTPEVGGDGSTTGPASVVEAGLGNNASSSSSIDTHSDDSVSNPLNRLTLAAEDEELNTERAELLKKTDRYGFFSLSDERLAPGGSSRSRVAVLPIQQLRHIPRRRLNPLHGARSALPHHHHIHSHHYRNHKAGASAETKANGDDSPDDAESRTSALHNVLQLRSNREANLQEREALRACKWARMLDVGRAPDGKPLFLIAASPVRSRKLKERTYKGIPDRWRSAVWWALLCTRPASQSASEHEVAYSDTQRQPSVHDVQIDLDVPRTISGHILFHTRYGQGQRSLFHVLHAFSLLCPQCGYCQGMGPIVATLLVYFPPERAYGVMVELHKEDAFAIHQTFSPGFPGLIENFWVQSKLADLLVPDVISTLDSHGIVTSAYATKWYITLYTNVVPFATQLRLWDAFFLQGKDVLVVVAVAILWSLRMELTQGSFETCMRLLGSELIPFDDDAFLHWIYTVMQRDDVRRCLSHSRTEWNAMIAQGKELPVL